MKSKFKNSLVPELIPIILIIIVGEISILHWKTGPIPPILIGIISSALVAYFKGENLKNIEEAMASGVKRVFPALLTVILVGLIISSWIIGGVIPTMVFWGFKIINFNNFLPIVFIVTSVVAIITGTSFTSIGTIGVSFMIIARQASISPEAVAGTIVSGAFLGDKMSPLSDTTNISAALGKVDLFEHIRYMLFDTIPAFLISLIAFKLINKNFISNNIDFENINIFLNEITTAFNLNIFLLVIPLVVVLMGIKKIPSITVLFSAVLMGVISSFLTQNFKAVDIIRNTVLGVKQNFENPAVTRLFSKGGVGEASSTAIIIIFIGCLIGIMNECNTTQNLLKKVQNIISSAKQLSVVTFFTSLMVGFVTGAQLLAIILPISIFLPLFNKFKLNNKNITRIVEATGTVGITLVPWSVPGIFIAKTLEVNMVSVIPYLFFPISIMMVNLILNLGGIAVSKINDN
ncbi:MAG: sodium:proton antiporter [Fusobacterium sp.]|nr:sodium:proton antiporter [Fusobacterium sp.]